MVLDTLKAADRVNLLEVYARSSLLIELGRCEEWADLFEPSAVLETELAQQPSSAQKYKGRSELLALARRMIEGEFDLAVGLLTPPLRCRHILTDISLYAEGAYHSVGHAHLTVGSIAGTAPPRWLASGLYTDRLGKCASGCWRFLSRTLAADGAAIGATIVKPSTASLASGA